MIVLSFKQNLGNLLDYIYHIRFAFVLRMKQKYLPFASFLHIVLLDNKMVFQEDWIYPTCEFY